MREEHVITPSMLAVIAVISIGGLLLVGLQSSIVGKATGESYSACCTVQSLQSAPAGFKQGTAKTSSEYCGASETPEMCCARSGAQKSNLPTQVLGAIEGSCNPPQKEYPAEPVFGQSSVCCSFETWKHSPTGYAQSVAQTITAYCNDGETDGFCCLRTAQLQTDDKVKILGTISGDCGSSQPTYPTIV